MLPAIPPWDIVDFHGCQAHADQRPTLSGTACEQLHQPADDRLQQRVQFVVGGCAIGAVGALRPMSPDGLKPRMVSRLPCRMPICGCLLACTSGGYRQAGASCQATAASRWPGGGAASSKTASSLASSALALAALASLT